jgi:uncharacterized protein YjiS (DUF1127 family)
MTTRIMLWDSGLATPRGVAETVRAGSAALRGWRHRRRSRRLLADIDDHLLRDLGIDARWRSAGVPRGYAVDAHAPLRAPLFLGR